MAVEEAWAQFSQAAGVDGARSRVDDARNALSEHFQQLRDSLSKQREELAQAEAALERRKHDFREERQQLSEWIAQRDERLRLAEQRLRQDTDTLDSREAAWRTARDGWIEEKRGAEQIIRDLLRQLGEPAEPAADSVRTHAV
jgi:chromosome segregation ATPase